MSKPKAKVKPLALKGRRKAKVNASRAVKLKLPPVHEGRRPDRDAFDRDDDRAWLDW